MASSLGSARKAVDVAGGGSRAPSILRVTCMPGAKPGWGKVSCVTEFWSPLAANANEGRVALVSGGGTGIGRATALALAYSGARIVVCGRRIEPLEAVRAEIEATGTQCLVVQADLRDSEAIERLVDEALRRFGEIDVLVNNAGGQFSAPAETISENGWRAVHSLTVDAAWNLTRTVALRSMIANRRGVIVFIGFSPRRGIPGFAHAAAARAALENLAGGLACEWSRYGIRAVCVALGAIATEALEGYGSDEVAQWVQATPLRRMGRPEEAAALIAFVTSRGAEYMTGTTIVLDGGADAWGQGEPAPELETDSP